MDLFPEQLLTKDGLKPTSEVLAGKEVIGIYFSASWCGPCHKFTPELAKWYEHFTTSHAQKDKLEIVFASSDRDDKSFQEYYKDMPWTAIPFDKSDAKEKLSRKFKVEGIPTLVFVDKDGNTLTTSGRVIIATDPEGEDYPWKPKPVHELLGDKFVDAKGEEHGKDALSGKYLGLYFSAHWCPPCKMFTPMLAKTYQKLKDQNKPFEIVFVSSDRSEDSFKEYLGEMPWLALPFADRKAKEALSARFEVQGIPTFVILDQEGNTVTTDGRSAVMSDPEGEKFPWIPQPLDELNEGTIGRINESPALICLTDDVKGAMAMLEPIAKEEEAVAKAAKRDQLIFLVGSPDDEAGSMLTDFASIQPPFPKLVIMNIPEQCKHMASNNDITEANVKSFVADFVAGKLKAEKIR